LFAWGASLKMWAASNSKSNKITILLVLGKQIMAKRSVGAVLLSDFFWTDGESGDLQLAGCEWRVWKENGCESESCWLIILVKKKRMVARRFLDPFAFLAGKWWRAQVVGPRRQVLCPLAGKSRALEAAAVLPSPVRACRLLCNDCFVSIDIFWFVYSAI
jgi:hypothetical protein